MRTNLLKKTLTMMLAFAMVFTMMPLLGAGVQEVQAADTAPGGAVASNNVAGIDTAKVNTVSAATAFGSSNVTASYNSGSKTLTILLLKNIILSSPVMFVKGNNEDKIILNLNGHTITGKAGATSDELSDAFGGNAIEIAADDFDVEIKGPGSVIGGKGGKWNRPDYRGYRLGVHGGSAVFFCKRVDKVHDVTGYYNDIIDEGYHPDKLEHGLIITGGANLVGGAGADVTLEDWKYNLGLGDEDLFSVTAGKGGAAIGQVFSDTAAGSVFEELSYAKIVVENGTVTGGAGGNVYFADQLLRTTDIQKISEIQQFMKGKEAGYDFDSHVKDNMKFKPANGGNGIEFYAGRKYVEVGNNGSVTGGAGGRFNCSEKASMVKTIDTKCGSGGIGISVCGDIGLTNKKPSLTAASWAGKNNKSDDVGIYVAGKVTGGASPSTTLLGDSSGAGGEGIDCDLGDYLCETYTVKYGHRPTFDEDRGIVLVADGGKVTGGAAGASGEKNIAGGLGADGVNGGSSGGPTASADMSAAYFIINGEVSGGYGSSQGGSGFHMKKEMEYLDDTQSSAYFGGVIYGSGKIRGGDSGEWPNIGLGYTADSNRVITKHGNYGEWVVRGEGINFAFGSHESASTIGSELSVSDGEPAKLMTTSGTFSVTPSMTPFAIGTAPNSNTKLSCTVKTPNGYNGKVYIMWSADYENTTPKTARVIEGANGAYNNFGLLSNSDYPYGWKADKYPNYTLYTYHINVATTDHIAESIKYNDNTEVHINCHVLLEDGRFIDNDDIWFSKERRSSKGWGGSSGGGSDQEEQARIDQEAADAVVALIEDLPSLSTIILEDEDAVKAARAAYDALTQAQKDLLAPYVYLLEKLKNAEAKIRELKGDADKVQAVIDLIDELAAPEDVTEVNAQAELAKINTIRTKIAELDESQLELLQQNADALDKLRQVETAVNEKLAAEHEHLMCHVPAKAATCSAEGNKEYYFCILCNDGKHYKDAAGTIEITGSVELEIDPDAHVIQPVPERAATCSSTGLMKHYECTACGKLFDDANGTIEITDPDVLITETNPNNHTWWHGKSKTAFYTDYYRVTRNDLCTGCGITRNVVVATRNYKGGLPAVKAAKAKAGKKKFTAKWKKVSKKNQKKIGGIEIQVQGPGIDKIYTAGKSKSSITIKVPIAKKKYKYRVRAYKGSGTAKQISKWSGWKSVKVK